MSQGPAPVLKVKSITNYKSLLWFNLSLLLQKLPAAWVGRTAAQGIFGVTEDAAEANWKLTETVSGEKQCHAYQNRTCQMMHKTLTESYVNRIRIESSAYTEKLIPKVCISVFRPHMWWHTWVLLKKEGGMSQLPAILTLDTIAYSSCKISAWTRSSVWHFDITTMWDIEMYVLCCKYTQNIWNAIQRQY